MVFRYGRQSAPSVSQYIFQSSLDTPAQSLGDFGYSERAGVSILRWFITRCEVTQAPDGLTVALLGLGFAFRFRLGLRLGLALRLTLSFRLGAIGALRVG